MNHSKSPSKDAPQTRQISTPQFSRLGRISSFPLGTHFANTPQGVLASGDLARLRNYVLEVADLQTQAQRLDALWQASVTRLSQWARTKDSLQLDGQAHGTPAVVKATLVGWPIVLSMSHGLAIRSLFQWSDSGAKGLQEKLRAAWAQALDVAPNRIEIHCVLHPQYLVGATPLQFKDVLDHALKQVTSRRESQVHRPSMRDVRAVLAGCERTTSRLIGPNQPTVLIMTAVVAADWDGSVPESVSLKPHIHADLQNLLQGVFTHETQIPGAASGRSNRIRHAANVQVGQPSLLPNAVTQAQAMELGWMGYRARQIGACVEHELSRSAGFIHWSSRLLNEDQEELGRVQYCYDDFWRPFHHIETIQKWIAFTQATGLMFDQDQSSSVGQ